MLRLDEEKMIAVKSVCVDTQVRLRYRFAAGSCNGILIVVR